MRRIRHNVLTDPKGESEDTVQELMRGLDSLKPLGEDLHREEDRRRAEDVICPRHPEKQGVRLRTGSNKRGKWVMFEPVPGLSGPDGWRFYKECNNAQIAALLAIDDVGRLECHQGPAGCYLFFYTEDTQPP
jgi:hypothetical protein